MADPTSNISGASTNPYRPPQAEVKDVQTAQEGTLIDGGRRVPVGNGVSWWGGGWSLFKDSPGIWILITIIFFVLAIVVQLIPLIGWLLYTLLSPVLVGGIMLGCRALRNGDSLEVGHLFAGFKEHTGSLVLMGLLNLAATIAVVLIIVLLGFVMIGGAGLAAMGSGGDLGAMAGMGLVIWLFVLIAFALFLPVLMLYWFAPALVVFHGLGAPQAMGMSFVGCLRNFVPFIVWGLLGLVLAIIATIPLALGWLVLIPMIWGSMYSGYRDIYLGDAS